MEIITIKWIMNLLDRKRGRERKQNNEDRFLKAKLVKTELISQRWTNI